MACNAKPIGLCFWKMNMVIFSKTMRTLKYPKFCYKTLGTSIIYNKISLPPCKKKGVYKEIQQELYSKNCPKLLWGLNKFWLILYSTEKGILCIIIEDVCTSIYRPLSYPFRSLASVWPFLHHLLRPCTEHIIKITFVTTYTLYTYTCDLYIAWSFLVRFWSSGPLNRFELSILDSHRSREGLLIILGTAKYLNTPKRNCPP